MDRAALGISDDFFRHITMKFMQRVISYSQSLSREDFQDKQTDK